MWLPRGGGNSGGKDQAGGKIDNKVIAVAIDKNKGSQQALKWATDNLLTRGQTVVLIYVLHKSSSVSAPGQSTEAQTKDLFLTFHCFCTRKDIQCLDIVLEDTDVSKALTEYVSCSAIEYLILGASSRHSFIRRFKVSDIPTNVSKGCPDFCTVYVISKGKISSVRNASRPVPFVSPLCDQIQEKNNASSQSESIHPHTKHSLSMKGKEPTPRMQRQTVHDDTDIFRSPFTRGTRGGLMNGRMNIGDFSDSDTDLSFVSSGRASTDRASSAYGDMDFVSAQHSRISTGSDQSFISSRVGFGGNRISNIRMSDSRSTDVDISPIARGFSTSSFDEFSDHSYASHNTTDDVDSEMRKLKLELQKTMDMYSSACKEALTAKEKASELDRWRAEEGRRLDEARVLKQAAMNKEREKAKSRALLETAEAAHRIAEKESQRRVTAELKESDTALFPGGSFKRYRIEEIEEATEYFAKPRKIGEGGYGPVYKCILDHTPVAVKVLRPDAAQGRSQFQQEVEVLGRMRHPNMVLLLGACPEYGCLVYEYLAKGSLDDRLFRKGNTPPLSWQLRFKIAAEITTALLFLHQTKPEPLVHRDLKPGNILLDHNYISKISDVGLARLVPPSVADDVTQYRMTSTAGTFCYIDPEYQQTGMLGVKSDVYSLGVMLLQIITARPPMGLTHHVDQAIDNGTFKDMLDPAVGDDWPVEEALGYAKLALQCAELRRKDRPDLGKVVLPELNRLRLLGEENMASHYVLMGGDAGGAPSDSPTQSQVSTVLSEQHSGESYESSKAQSLASVT